MNSEISIVLVTRDLAKATALSDRIIIMADGKVIQTSSLGDVTRAPLCPEVEHLVLQPYG